MAIEWRGKSVTINGVKYVAREMGNDIINIYDKKSYEDALSNPNVVPVQIGTLEKNKRGETVFNLLVNK